MNRSPILEAITQICEEKNVSRESVLATIEAALAVAYRKDFGEKNQNIKAMFDPETAAARIYDVKEVVEDALFEEYTKQQEELERLRAEAEANPEAAAAQEALEKKEAETPVAPMAEEGEEEKEKRFDPKSMIALSEAQKTKTDVGLGDEIRTELFPPENYGRMAAQTAKQVIIQRLREAERENILAEYSDKVGTIITGTIQRQEGRVVLIDLGRAAAVMPPSEQIDREHYLPGQRIKLYVVAVNTTTRGPEIVVSRAHPDMVRKLFALEVPEVASGAITIKAVAREAGSRTKIAVYTAEPNIDPVGSCVGQRGTRVQTIIGEIGGEKIDIIQFEDDVVRFIISALSPAKIISVKLYEEEHRAIAEVKEDQLSLAIGRAGQNVRLAARLTGWKIDIVKESGGEVLPVGATVQPAEEAAKPTDDAPASKAPAAPAETNIEKKTAPGEIPPATDANPLPEPDKPTA